MKLSTFLLISCLFFACKPISEDGVLPKKKKYKDLRAVYIESACCANMMLLDDVRIQTENETYDHNLLAVTNIQILPATFVIGDTLTATFTYSDEPFNCEIICNNHNGIKVAIEDWRL